MRGCIALLKHFVRNGGNLFVIFACRAGALA
jgi:hypothetical protein